MNKSGKKGFVKLGLNLSLRRKVQNIFQRFFLLIAAADPCCNGFLLRGQLFALLYEGIVLLCINGGVKIAFGKKLCDLLPLLLILLQRFLNGIQFLQIFCPQCIFQRIGVGNSTLSLAKISLFSMVVNAAMMLSSLMDFIPQVSLSARCVVQAYPK